MARPWPVDLAPSRERFEGFGHFVDLRTEDMGAACRARRMPQLLTDAIERCSDHYWLRGDHLVRLRRIRSSRRKRTERRCAHVAVLQFLIAHVDLVSMQCLVGGAEGLRPPSVAEIAARTGLARRRVESVLGDLAQVGYLRTKRRHQKVEQPSGSVEIVNQVAVRWLSLSVFTDLGLPTTLALERRRAIKRREATQKGKPAGTQCPKPGARAPDSALGFLAKGLLMAQQPQTGPAHGPTHGPVRRPQHRLAAGAQDPTAAQLEIARRVGTIKLQHPDWDREACYAEARRQLGQPPDH